jgi:hypothetical protein
MATYLQDSGSDKLVVIEAQHYDSKSDSTWAGNTIIQDTFASPTGSISGRTPDTADIGSTFTIADTVAIESDGRVHMNVTGNWGGFNVQSNMLGNHYVEVDFKPDHVSGTSKNRGVVYIEKDGSGGLTWPWTGYAIYTFDSSMILKKYSTGSPAQENLDTWGHTLDPSATYTLKLAREDNDVVGYINGTERLRGANETDYKGNIYSGAGIGYEVDANSWFDNFKVHCEETVDDSWDVDSTPPSGSYSGTAMEASGTTRTFTQYYERNAKMVFKVQFVATGTHRVWLRMYCPDNTKDRAHVGFDGSIDNSNHNNFDAETYGSWTWVNLNELSQAREINVTSTGVHTVEVYSADQGLHIDRILLTTNTSYNPNSVSPQPAESAQVGEATITGVEGASGIGAVTADAPMIVYPNGLEIAGTVGAVTIEDVDISFEIPSGVGATGTAAALNAFEGGEHLDGCTEARMILSAKHITETIAAYTPTDSPQGVVTLPITRTFANIQDIKLAFHDIGSTAHYYEVVSSGGSIDNENPQVKLYNASGSPIVLTNVKISATVIGY